MHETTTQPLPIRREIAETLRLAGPAIIARAGMLLMSIADTVMVGRYATADLAYLGIAWSMSTTLLVANIGLLMGTLVKTSHAFGRNDLPECGRVWRRGLPLAFAAGGLGFALCFLSEPLLLALGQTADVAREGAVVTIAYGAGLPAIAIAIASQFFLEGIKRPIPGMVFMMFANVLNIGLNFLLIYGSAWTPEMGAAGAAWATTAARTMLALLAVAYILMMREHAIFGVRNAARRDWPAYREQLRIGLATGVALIAESAAFNGLTQMAGILGVAALGSFTATMNLVATVFMTAIGIGVATSVRVGAAWGADDPRGAARAGWTGLGVNTVTMAVIAVLLAPTAEFLAAAYGLDAAAQTMAARSMQLAGLVILVDGAQAVLANALRARADVWPTTIIQVLCFWGVMLPAGWFLAFEMEWGPAGLVGGIGVGTAVSTAALGWRFAALAKRDRRRGMDNA